MLKTVAERLERGERVTFRPKGGSMAPVINPADEVVVAPFAEGAGPEVGDIVLVTVGGSIYLHFVDVVDLDRARVRIANRRGRINGWARISSVHGLCVEVRGVGRSGVEGRVARM